MAWDELDLGINTRFPSLWVVPSWVEAHCVIPDGFRRGDWFDLVLWQAIAYLNHYRVKPAAERGQLSSAFHNQLSMIVLPQKAGKAPFSSSRICAEGVGPVVFAGWAGKGDGYACSDHGCGCGWEYEYQPGEPMGQRWPTPLIQITATSEDQTGNIYTALRPMIDDGPLADLIPKTGEDFIRLPDNGRIDPVTSNGRSRLGQRVTDVEWDEPGLYLKQNKMYGYSEAVFDTQWRGVVAMGGRGCLTTNAWDPSQDSAAKMVAKLAETHDDVYVMHPQAPAGLRYTIRSERRKIHKVVYAGCPWIDLDAIEGLAKKLLDRDPGQAERFYGNNPVAGEGVAFDMDQIGRLTRPRQVPANATIVLGIDGARFHDAMAIVACEVKTGYYWVVGVWERPADAHEDYEHPRHLIDGAIAEVWERYNVWRAYVDPQHIDDLLKGWQNEYGEKRFVPWWTNRPRQMCWAVRDLEDDLAGAAKAIAKGEAPALTHSGDHVLLRHMANARKKTELVLDDKERPMHTLSKEHAHSKLFIDLAIGMVLARVAQGHCIASGAESLNDAELEPEAQRRTYAPNEAPPADWFEPAPDYGPMGTLS